MDNYQLLMLFITLRNVDPPAVPEYRGVSVQLVLQELIIVVFLVDC